MDVSVISVTFSNSGPVIDGSLDLVRKIESGKRKFSLNLEIFSVIMVFLDEKGQLQVKSTFLWKFLFPLSKNISS